MQNWRQRRSRWRQIRAMGQKFGTTYYNNKYVTCICHAISVIYIHPGNKRSGLHSSIPSITVHPFHGLHSNIPLPALCLHNSSPLSQHSNIPFHSIHTFMREYIHPGNMYIDYLPKLGYPVRSGVHSNTAFSLNLAFDYACESCMYVYMYVYMYVKTQRFL